MLMPKMKGLKGLFQKNKHRRRFGIKDYLAMVLIPLALLFVIFIATDNFMLYWFVLMNNDEDLEARRREDFHWYDSSGQSYTPGSTGSSSSPGYVEKYDLVDNGNFKDIRITLKYGKDKNDRIIAGIKRISKPGLRVYAGRNDMPKVLGGLGIAIVSTNKGVMTDKKARELNVGGEVLAFVW